MKKRIIIVLVAICAIGIYSTKGGARRVGLPPSGVPLTNTLKQVIDALARLEADFAAGRMPELGAISDQINQLKAGLPKQATEFALRVANLQKRIDDAAIFEDKVEINRLELSRDGLEQQVDKQLKTLTENQEFIAAAYDLAQSLGLLLNKLVTHTPKYIAAERDVIQDIKNNDRATVNNSIYQFLNTSKEEVQNAIEGLAGLFKLIDDQMQVPLENMVPALRVNIEGLQQRIKQLNKTLNEQQTTNNNRVLELESAQKKLTEEKEQLSIQASTYEEEIATLQKRALDSVV